VLIEVHRLMKKADDKNVVSFKSEKDGVSLIIDPEVSSPDIIA
jgi:hypothetical protein